MKFQTSLPPANFSSRSMWGNSCFNVTIILQEYNDRYFNMCKPHYNCDLDDRVHFLPSSWCVPLSFNSREWVLRFPLRPVWTCLNAIDRVCWGYFHLPNSTYILPFWFYTLSSIICLLCLIPSASNRSVHRDFGYEVLVVARVCSKGSNWRVSIGRIKFRSHSFQGFRD